MEDLKDWYGWTKNGLPTKIAENGNVFSKPADIARIMNTYFVSKITSLVTNLGEPVSCPLDPVRKIMEGRHCNIKLHAVHPDHVEKISDCMKSMNSCGNWKLKLRMVNLRMI